MELSKNYIPGTVEEKWYQHWMSRIILKACLMKGRPLPLLFLHQM